MREVIFLRAGLPDAKSPCEKLTEVKKSYISRKDQEFFNNYIKEHRDDQELIFLIKQSWKKYEDSYRIMEMLLKEYTAIDKNSHNPIDRSRKEAVWNALSTFCHSSKCLAVYSGEIGIKSKFGIMSYDDVKYNISFKDIYENQNIYPSEMAMLTPRNEYYYRIFIAGEPELLPMDLIDPFCDFHCDGNYPVIKASKAPDDHNDYLTTEDDVSGFWIKVNKDWSQVDVLHSGESYKTPWLNTIHNEFNRFAPAAQVFASDHGDGFSYQDKNGEYKEIIFPENW